MADIPAKKAALAAKLQKDADRMREAIEAKVAEAPPLTDEQRAELRRLLGPSL